MKDNNNVTLITNYYLPNYEIDFPPKTRSGKKLRFIPCFQVFTYGQNAQVNGKAKLW